MRWSLDGNANALYFTFSTAEIARQVELDDGTIVDIDINGAVVGIEVLSVRNGWNPDAVLASFSEVELPVEDRAALLQFVLAASSETAMTGLRPGLATSTRTEAAAQLAPFQRVA